MTSTSHGVRVRAMTVTDLDRVVAIADSLKKAPRWTRESYLRALDAAAPVRRIALVAEQLTNGEIAGFAIVGLNQPEAELETLAVMPAAQRRGVARQLFDEATRLLRQHDVSAVSLEVRASNVVAQGLYLALDFHEVGRRPRYYVDPVEDAVLMRLSFRPHR